MTGPLLTRVPAAFHGGINDVLLTGLVVAIAAWRRRRGRGASAAVLIDIEGHGREEIFPDVDLSRTVGWFTSLYPMRLDPGPLDVEEAMAGGPAFGRAVKLIKEQLHAVPNHGVGYGLLRYLNPQTARELDGLARPQLGFNYLGRFPGAPGANWAGAAEADVLGGGDSDLPLAHAVEINALTLEGADGATLRASWTWSPALIDETDLRALAQDWFQALEALVRHTAQPSAGGRTPSDLPLVPLSQNEIERLERKHPQIDQILPLSPLQEGLLFHALSAAEGPDIYKIQLELILHGPLEGRLLRTSVEALLGRHASLRAGFQHENLNRPVQVIVSSAVPRWESIDLSELDTAGRDARVAEIVARDRAEPFALGSPPLIRFTLIRLGRQEHRLLLTSHHILLDGWSLPVLVRELFSIYAQKGDGASLPRVTPYRDYLAWIAAQDRHRLTMAGLAGGLRQPEEPAALWRKTRGGRELRPKRSALRWNESATAALSQAARRQGLTLNTYVQAAWSILLGRLTGQDDVVFGVTVAGRPPEIAGIESMVGLFINTLPLRVKLPPAKGSTISWRNCRKANRR